MGKESEHWEYYRAALIGLLATGILYWMSRESYLLFHTTAEVLSVVVAAGVFVVAWNGRRFAENSYLLFLGIASLFVAGLDLLHALAYKDMGVFPGLNPNPATQLWIAGRFLQAASFLAAPLWIGRKLRIGPVLLGFVAFTGVVVLSVFHWHTFPTCWVDGIGLTEFKKIAEYVICLMLAGAAAHLLSRRQAFDDAVLKLLLGVIGASILSELSFTLYHTVTDMLNLSGHLLKVLAFYFLYAAIVETSFRKPYSLLLRDLQSSKSDLEDAYADLQAHSEELLAHQSAMRELADELAAGQARLEAIVQQMPAGVVIAQVPSGRILLANDEAARIFGSPIAAGADLEACAGWPRLHPDGRPYLPDEVPVVRALRRGETITGEEMDIVQADGVRRTISVNTGPVYDKSGRAVAAVSVNLDITERKRAEEGLVFLAGASQALASSLDYQATLDTVARLAVPAIADCCIVDILGDDGAVRRLAVACADPALQEIADRLRQFPPVPGMPGGVAGVITSGRTLLQPVVDAGFLEASAQGPEHLEILRRLGIASCMVVPMVARGRTRGALAFLSLRPSRRYAVTDVTLAEEVGRRAALALDNAFLYREAQEANEAKEQFIAVVSHELRNPLAAIMGSVDLLRRDVPADGRAAKVLDIIDRNAKLQTRLVNDLLDLSRISRGKLHLQRAPLSIDSVASAAVQAQQMQAEEAGVFLSVDAASGQWVLGDFDRLQQVILNLLSNAIKFTPAGGRVSVRVREAGDRGQGAGGRGQEAEAAAGTAPLGSAATEPQTPNPEPPKVLLTVRDTGAGIAQDLLPHLFEMFHQGEVGGQRRSGLGIGLALVKGIVEMHGGRVWAESDGPGKGSCFTMELPTVAHPRRPAPDSAAPESRREICILLVEDNPDTCALVRQSLSLMGYRVEAATTAEDAIEALARVRPDVIVSDIGLPGMNGYEFLQRARSVPGLQQVPAFAVTGLGKEEDVRRAREAGYVGHFVKPVDISALERHIRECLGAKPPAPAR